MEYRCKTLVLDENGENQVGRIDKVTKAFRVALAVCMMRAREGVR